MASGIDRDHAQTPRVTCKDAGPAMPSRSARVRRCLTEEGCHRVPARRCAFAHGLELGSNLLQRATGRDAGDQPDQAIVALLRPGAAQQACFDDALVPQPPHRAAQPPNRPGRGLAAIKNLRDVAPGLVGTHAPHRWQPASGRANTPFRWAAARLARIVWMASGPATRRPVATHAPARGVQV